ncbi:MULTISPECIES: AEC family transporter [unclassified Salinicola]|uniref:AEC family transporter n=1 Tax=unclassified Salinicola TaxID=2634022 RepID=UPI001A8F2D59|nr:MULTISPECIES: AEC family transporter [unclassified Salinicola]MCE3028480.1 AEC family transporter [Salinicola sp. DM10]WIX33418.1 AEC family transporter [Salinicola sp. JS01]
MSTIFGAIVPIFILLAIGYLAVLKRVVDKAHIQGMGRYVINIALPALVIQALLQRPLGEVFNVPYLLVYGLGSGLAFALTFALVTLRGNAPLARRAMYALGTSASNSGFIGYPVAVLVVGPSAGIALALNMLIENLLVIPTALVLAEFASQNRGSLWATVRPVALRVLRHPLILAIAAGSLLAALDLHPPAPLARVLEMLAASSSPVALFVIGGTLCGLRVRGMVKRVTRLALAKLTLHPLCVVLMVLLIPGLDPVLATAAIVFACAPMLSMYPLLGQRYGFAEMGTAAMVMATLLSALTLALGIWLSHQWLLGTA